MTTLYIDKKGLQLDVQNAALILREADVKVGSVPLKTVQRIFLRGEVNLPAKLLAKLGELKIGLVVLAGWQHTPTLFLPRAHHDANRRLNQARLYLNDVERIVVIKQILIAKLNAQITLIEQNLAQLPNQRYALFQSLQTLQTIRHNIHNYHDHNALLGAEGAAAHCYFQAYAAILPEWTQFKGRNRRPPKDPANALMSLAYTLLHAEAVLAAYEAGLDPDIGMLHSISFGRESLACDLMEPLRPLADNWIAQQLRKQYFTADDFSQTELGCLLGKVGRMRFYEHWEEAMPAWRKQLQIQVQTFCQYLEVTA